jgi:hypothetical protein
MWKALMSAASVLCVLSATAAAAQDRPRTGDEFVKVGLARNRELLAARERVAETQGLLRGAFVRPSPTFELDDGGRLLGSPGTEELFPRCKRGKRQAIGVSGAADGEFAPRTRQP